MEVEIRLKAVLRMLGLDRHGITQDIVNETGLSRHTVRKLYAGTARAVSLDTLGLMCRFLEDRNVSGLPGVLFGARPPLLVEALAERRQVLLYLAVYRSDEFPRAWVARDDAAVQSRLIAMLSRLKADQPTPIKTEHIESDAAPGEHALEADKSRVQEIFNRMRRDVDSASVIIGSQRANYLQELFVSDLFGATPFVSGPSPVPFYLRFLEKPRTDTCFGGAEPPPDAEAGTDSGIYFRRTPRASWECLPCDRARRGAGAVVLRRDASLGKLEMGIFGLSAISTAAMGKILDSRPGGFWFRGPSSGVQKAVFLASFTLDGPHGTGSENIDQLDIGDIKVIELQLD